MGHIFTFEWLLIRKSGEFIITAIMLPLLIGYSLYLGTNRVNIQRSTIQELKSAEVDYYDDLKSRLLAIERGEVEVGPWWQDPSNPLVVGQMGAAGKHVFLEPKPLAALAFGQLDILPYYGKVNMTSVQPLRDNALDNPFLQMVGSFDLAFVLVWIVPLFVIAFGYNMLSSEKELGTYALLQSQPISLHRVTAYKLLFRLFLLYGILVISLIGWALVLNINLWHADGLTLFWIIMLYVGFWFVLCAFFNVLHTSSAVNAVGLTGLWVLFLLVVPSLISMLASSMHPVPSRALWTVEQRDIQQSVQSNARELFDAWLVDHPEEYLDQDTPVYYETWMRRFVSNAEVKRLELAKAAAFEEPRRNQSHLVAQLRIVSPPMLVQNWLEINAGTDAQRLRSLDETILSFQHQWNDYFLPQFQKLDVFTIHDFDSIPDPL